MQVRQEGRYRTISKAALAILRVSQTFGGRRISKFKLFAENVGTRDGWIIGWGNFEVISKGFECDVGLGNVRECAPVSAKGKAKAEAKQQR